MNKCAHFESYLFLKPTDDVYFDSFGQINVNEYYVQVFNHSLKASLNIALPYNNAIKSNIIDTKKAALKESLTFQLQQSSQR